MDQQSNDVLLDAADVTKVFQIRHGLSSTSFHAVDNASFQIEAAKPEIFTIAG